MIFAPCAGCLPIGQHRLAGPVSIRSSIRYSLRVQDADRLDNTDWPVQYHIANSLASELACEFDDDDVESALEACYTSGTAAATRAGLEKDFRQGLEDRRRHAEALLAASKSVLLSTFGGLRDIERRLNNRVAQKAACGYLMLYAFHAQKGWYLTTDGSRFNMQVRAAPSCIP